MAQKRRFLTIRILKRGPKVDACRKENTRLFYSASPMFVPSLSWQNDRVFYVKMARQKALF
jgi:hypothetical protein